MNAVDPLVGYVDGELDAAETASVERVLATDPAARRRLGALYRQRLVLAQIADAVAPIRTPSGVSASRRAGSTAIRRGSRTAACAAAPSA